MELDTKKWKPKNSWEAPPLFGSGWSLWFGLRPACAGLRLSEGIRLRFGRYVKLPGRLTSHSSVDSCGSLVPDFADIRAAHVLFTPGAIKTCTWKTEYSLGHRNLRVRKRSQFSMDVQRNVVTSNLRPGRCFKVYFYSSYACISRACRPNLSWIRVMKTGQSMGFLKVLHWFLAQGQLPSWFVWGPRKLSYAFEIGMCWLDFNPLGKDMGKWWEVFSTPQSIAFTAKQHASMTCKQSRPKMVPIRMGRPRDPNLGLSPGCSPTWFVHICKCRCHGVTAPEKSKPNENGP